MLYSSNKTVYTRVQVEFFGRENGLKKIDLNSLQQAKLQS